MLKLRTYERIFIKFTLDFNIANIMMYIICQFYVQFNCIVTINVFCKGNRNLRAPNIRSYSTNQKYTPCRRHKPLRFSSSYNYFTTLDGLQKNTRPYELQFRRNTTAMQKMSIINKRAPYSLKWAV